MIIDPKSLSEDALNGVIEAFIGREGTDYGAVELSLAEKVSALRPQVERGHVLIIFDQGAGEVTLVARQNYSESRV